MNVLANQGKENQLNYANSIYCKIHQIQSEIKKVFKTKRNNFQNYNFFTEPQILDLVKPLLAKYQLGLFISDEVHENSSDISFSKQEKEWVVKYLKKAELVDITQNTSPLTYYFWAVGSNTDIAKAKGAAETYASKYFLSKFFLIPIKDISDPDYRSETAEKKTPLTNSEPAQVQAFLKKHNWNPTKKTSENKSPC